MGMFEMKKGKEILEVSGNYGGGYAKICMNGMLKVKIQDSKLLFSQLWKTYHTLDIKNVVDVQYKSTQEITKDVTLVRLLAVGIFAFGLKKKKTNNNYYIIISTIEDGFSNDFVLEIENTMGMGTAIAQGFVTTLRNKIVEFREVETPITAPISNLEKENEELRIENKALKAKVEELKDKLLNFL